MHLLTTTLLALASTLVAASPVTFCAPEDNGICYSFSVPETTASSGQGDIFVQIRAPSTMSWVGLAQAPDGTMMGSNMFVAYASQNTSSVTLSPRLGTGHTMPKYNKNTQAVLLDGSGIVDGVMIANVQCRNCNSWQGGSMSFKDSSSMWLFAYTPGSASTAGAIHSNNVSAPISIHEGYGSFKVDLSKATSSVPDDANPFTGQALTSTTSDAALDVTYMDPAVKAKLARIKMAHGSILGLAFGLIFPAGAMLMRLHGKPTTWAYHAGIQIFAYALSVAGMGMGIFLALEYDLLNSPHALIGLVVIALLFFMPFAGWLQHSRFCRFQRRTWWGRSHAYLGRALVMLGMINVGTGLKLAAPYGGAAIKQGEIAYGVLAAVMGVAWLVIIAVTAATRRRNSTVQQGVASGGARTEGSQDRTSDPGSRTDHNEKGLEVSTTSL